MKKDKSKRKGGSKVGKHIVSPFLIQGKTIFLTYPGHDRKFTKSELVEFLLNSNPRQVKVKPVKYLICEQMYDNGDPHFHVILTYDRRKRIQNQSHYDYLDVHPNIQSMRNMKAALDYVYKQDPNPITNMDIQREKIVAKAECTSSLYQLLEQEMKKDPLRFDVDDYCVTHDIFKSIYKTNYSKAISLIKRAQPAYARAIYANKPGIKLITPLLIKQLLTEDEFEQYYSHPCYQDIINHINQIRQYPNKSPETMAPSKTRHLLIVGDSSIGKSALVDHRPNEHYPYPGLMHYYACYHLSIGEKFFPPYRSFDFSMVRWNQFTIDSDMFPKRAYHRLLDYLEGAPSALPQKGRPPVERQDNPKHILTSNRTLNQHIDKTFASSQTRTQCRSNLGSRIHCVQIPFGKQIHFLRKLFVSN